MFRVAIVVCIATQILGYREKEQEVADYDDVGSLGQEHSYELPEQPPPVKKKVKKPKMPASDAIRKPKKKEKREKWDDTFAVDDEMNDHTHDKDSLPSKRVRATPEDDKAKKRQKAIRSTTSTTTITMTTCALNPQVSTARRVVSMADQHGDFPHMLEHLQRLGLVSMKVTTENQNTWESMWVGRDAIFVQTGDILDRGPDGKVMYHFLWKLQDQAAASVPPGEVVLLFGNHELLVLQGDVRYVTNMDFCQYADNVCHPEEHIFCDDPEPGHACCTIYDKFPCDECMQGNCDHLQAWDKNGYMGKEFRKRLYEGKMKIAHKVEGIVYVHGGLLPFMLGADLRGDDYIEALNKQARELLQRSMQELWDEREHPLLSADGFGGSPVWTRVCEWEDPLQCIMIGDSLDKLGAERMVIGHCPQKFDNGWSDGVTSLCDGRFLLADTFMSEAYSGSHEASMNNMAALEFYSDGKPGEPIWSLYAGRDVESQCNALRLGPQVADEWDPQEAD